MTAPVVPLERGYCNDSAERWANRTMSQPSQHNGVSYKIYIYLHECTTHNSPEFSASTSRHPKHRLSDVQLPPHSAVSSCPSHFLVPPTPPFPLNPCPRRQRDRVATAWLQLPPTGQSRHRMAAKIGVLRARKYQANVHVHEYEKHASCPRTWHYDKT